MRWKDIWKKVTKVGSAKQLGREGRDGKWTRRTVYYILEHGPSLLTTLSPVCIRDGVSYSIYFSGHNSFAVDIVEGLYLLSTY